LFDGDICVVQFLDYLFDRCRGDKTQTGGSCRCILCIGFELLTDLMKIYFLLAEMQCLAVVAKGDFTHTKHTSEKINRGGNIRHGEYKMIEMNSFHMQV